MSQQAKYLVSELDGGSAPTLTVSELQAAGLIRDFIGPASNRQNTIILGMVPSIYDFAAIAEQRDKLTG